jgi:hypothetical protein
MKPKNRTSKRISEYPFQPVRRNDRRFPQRDGTGRHPAQAYQQAYHTSAEREFSSIPKTSRLFFIGPPLWPN